jgi:hypothetical protein
LLGAEEDAVVGVDDLEAGAFFDFVLGAEFDWYGGLTFAGYYDFIFHTGSQYYSIAGSTNKVYHLMNGTTQHQYYKHDGESIHRGKESGGNRFLGASEKMWPHFPFVCIHSILTLLFVVALTQSQIHISISNLQGICVLKPSNVASKFGGSGVNQDAEKNVPSFPSKVPFQFCVR